MLYLSPLLLATVTSAVSTSYGLQIDPSSVSKTCAQIADAVPGIVSYPNQTIYEFEESRYWSSFQANQKPSCRVTPTSAKHVSTAIKIITKNKTKFSVKSGGHAAMAGASNNDDGVVIDLLGLNDIQVAQDKKSVVYGTGNRWLQIYQYLDPLGISVLGGRVADIGVGGLTLGGGLSFVSNRYGWVAGGVMNFEVVLADGSIVNANEKENQDLWWALKGGGNNFGVVTHLTAKAFPQGLMWAGSRYFPVQTTNQSLISAYVNVVKNMDHDLDTHIIMAMSKAASIGSVAVLDFDYAIPKEFPPIYSEIAALTPIYDTMRITNLSALTVEFNQSNPGGFQNTYVTATYSLSAPLLSALTELFYAEIDPIFSSIAGFVPAMSIQPISTHLLSTQHKTGGNPLGISDRHGPLTLVLISLQWSNPADNAQILELGKRFIDKGNTIAKSMGEYNRFIYQNYAQLEQDVFGGYGAGNKERLQRIASKYDMNGVFQVLQPGYFKVF